ncbi:MAG: hypothetical protein R6V83_04205 [Candidatus Thorarchaeota archaeon]
MNHASANGFLSRVEDGEFGRMVTKDNILDELTTLTMARVDHTAAVKLYKSIINSKSIEFVHVTPELGSIAFDIFRDHPDQEYSFTDCVSFAHFDSYMSLEI